MVWICDEMVVCVVQELIDGVYVNFGIGLLILVVNYIFDGVDVWLQLENGLFGIGLFLIDVEVDVDLINVGKQMVIVCVGVSYFGSYDSFVMIRGGYVNLVIFGVMQVIDKGDLVNWMVFGKMVKGMGGVMDLVVGVQCVVVLMEYIVKNGEYKILVECMLLLIGVGVVDWIIIDLVVFDVIDKGLLLVEVVLGVSD